MAILLTNAIHSNNSLAGVILPVMTTFIPTVMEQVWCNASPALFFDQQSFSLNRCKKFPVKWWIKKGLVSSALKINIKAIFLLYEELQAATDQHHLLPANEWLSEEA